MKNIGMNNSVKTLAAITFAYMAFFGAVLFSVSSNAAVAEPGTFVPAACGEPVHKDDDSEPIVSQVCLGHIVGEPSKSAMGAFEFRDEAGRPAVYRVTEVSNLLIKLMSGAVRLQVYMVGPNGEEMGMKINRKGDAFENAAGQIGDAKFVVPEFAPVAVAL